MRSRFLSIKLPLLFLLLIVSFFIGISYGSTNTSFSDILSFFAGNSESYLNTIMTEIRIPRVLLALAIGGGLSVAGAVYQAILLNPLAEPYILGVSSGGTLGAVISFLIGASFFVTQLFAFTGALTVVFLVYIVGKRFGKLEANTLLLSGVMIGAFFSAGIMLSMAFIENSLRNVVFWLIGNLSLADPNNVIYVLPASILITIYFSIFAFKFNILATGEENARHLGLNTQQLFLVSYILTSLLIGLIVSVSGIIGFVGLLIPHVSRLIFGIDNRIVIPSSFLLGASFLILSDTLSRTLIPPAEIPVGAITALIGAPVFIYLLKRSKHQLI